jgi:hypothetical protein
MVLFGVKDAFSYVSLAGAVTVRQKGFRANKKWALAHSSLPPLAGMLTA